MVTWQVTQWVADQNLTGIKAQFQKELAKLKDDNAQIAAEKEVVERHLRRLQSAQEFPMWGALDRRDLSAGALIYSPFPWTSREQITADPRKLPRLMKKYGLNPNAHYFHDGVTLLHIASENGQLPSVKYLLKIGARVNVMDDDGRTPLSLAAQRGHQQVVKLLLGRGANPRIKDKYGKTPLDWASFMGHKQVVRLLQGK